jgi:hypothetical protein
MLPHDDELLTDKELREATTAQLEDLSIRVNSTLQLREKQGLQEKPSPSTVYGNLEDLKVYTFTDAQFEAYRNSQDPQKAVAALGVESNRLTNEGLQKSDGSIERYADFDRRLDNARSTGLNRFTL